MYMKMLTDTHLQIRVSMNTAIQVAAYI